MLDFGLAKLIDRHPATRTTHACGRVPQTEEGTISARSPTCRRNRPTANRSTRAVDIFSFGSVLYEMLAGQRAFQGASRVSTLAAILHTEPRSLRGMSASVTVDVEKLVTRCLRKDPVRRWQHASDLAIALDDLKESESGAVSKDAAFPVPARRRILWWATGLGLAIGGVWSLDFLAQSFDIIVSALKGCSAHQLSGQ